VISRRVVNASPLIFLTRVGLLEVLREPGVPVLVPDIVIAEISSLGATDPAAQAVTNSSWIQVVSTPAIPVELLPWGLDAGEAGVIAVSSSSLIRWQFWMIWPPDNALRP
jgi:predicted nucleic acid-binding protein